MFIVTLLESTASLGCSTTRGAATSLLRERDAAPATEAPTAAAAQAHTELEVPSFTAEAMPTARGATFSAVRGSMAERWPAEI
mmetsp:Transcript_4357/g.7298  ORF Transcript_4357/g.7298 Transcript_4357/m.7298 type:complete len:83 (+) Transcript_4357:529-777(+)